MARERVPPARSTIATAVTLLAALLLVPLALAPRAEAFIYWTSGDPEAIGRANLDGTGINRHLIPDTTANAYPRDLGSMPSTTPGRLRVSLSPCVAPKSDRWPDMSLATTHESSSVRAYRHDDPVC